MRSLASALVIASMLLAGGCADAQPSGEATLVEPSDTLVRWFAETHPDCTIVTSAKEDLTADEAEDLVVVYSDADGVMYTRVVIAGDEPTETGEVQAPAENQRISFRDIDDTAPMELIVRGSKGADIGFAIYRVEDGELTDLFGENMDRCCEAVGARSTQVFHGS